MEFLVRFAHTHESFRLPELEALALLEGIEMTVLEYSLKSPFCLVKLPSVEAAQKLLKRSILAQSIHEFWGQGTTLSELHEDMRRRTEPQWLRYKDVTFKFAIDCYQGARSNTKKLSIINSFQFLPFEGSISLSSPDEVFTVFEVWEWNSVPLGIENPEKMFLGRLVGTSARETPQKYDLKKRGYISTTSMDAELSLVTANLALAAPGKLFYDPFVGTGSFPLACAHFGAECWGSDIDGMTLRGEGGRKSVRGNFEQYGLGPFFGGVFTADLTNSPIRLARIWDGVVCDPPYGVREGLRVLGLKDPTKTPWLVERGIQNAMAPDYVPPKKPYSFLAMLDDILVFASETLVDGGRLSFWMPTANDEEQEIAIPTHPCLELVSACIQPFYKWSRRLLTYRRLPDAEVSPAALQAYKARQSIGTTADELNPFRRGYFKKFEVDA
ncbi:S-adenosyl-L-methionine-dependent methyltransferase [Stachybotrys elegans]|uniref:tRNA (guanine(10)-N(2))-methyltransferase n=1 Tax=Stachybotrys elegans TaxID=80388 RepID=A0A8K0SN26_9HYPO|nr:S-adenosyl-L-methionine-dependent methyltransferase [Stachybotrys elegans]